MTTPQPQLDREVAGILKIKVNANVIFKLIMTRRIDLLMVNWAK